MSPVPLYVRTQPYNPSMPRASPSPETADSLYRGFPDFTSWGPLQPEDGDLWSRFAASLEERRKAATQDALKASVDVAIRAAALDTGAIEGLYTVDRGFTMTVAVQGLAWEQMVEERGAGIRELFEAQLAAYELVLDAATRKLPITEAWLRALHETLCAPQQTYRVLTAAGWQEHGLPKGKYKTQPNHVLLKDGTGHPYAPVDQVSTEMHRLVEQLQSPEFAAAHPALQASWVHYAFVAIHPFADGNGRVARALASVYFYRCCSVPLLVFANQKLTYLDALHAADLGELRPLITFFRDRGIDTMQLVFENLLTSELPASEPIAERLRRRPSPIREISPEQLDNLVFRLQSEVVERFQALIRRQGLSSHFSSSIQPEPGGVSVEIADRSISPAATRLTVSVDRFEEGPFLFRVLSSNPDGLEIRLEDVHPELSDVLMHRLDNWVERQLTRMLASLERQVPGETEK
jgi:Fic family protein